MSNPALPPLPRVRFSWIDTDSQIGMAEAMPDPDNLPVDTTALPVIRDTDLIALQRTAEIRNTNKDAPSL